MKSPLVSKYGTRKRVKEEAAPPPNNHQQQDDVIAAIQEVRDVVRAENNGANGLVEATKVLTAGFESSVRLLLDPVAALSKRICQLNSRLAELDETLIDLTIVLQNKRTKRKMENEEGEGVVL
jgi:hypothetical protein